MIITKFKVETKQISCPTSIHDQAYTTNQKAIKMKSRGMHITPSPDTRWTP